jgi:uncharacterized protein (TIGR03067 family)
MTHCLLLFAALTFAAEAEDANARDLQKMQGDWMVASMVTNGFQVPDDEAQSMFRTVKENKYTVFRFEKAVSEGTFQTDATQQPKTIDSRRKGLPDDAPSILGIYEFDGPRLVICNAPPGQERPSDFSAPEGSQHTRIVWEPEKK